MFGNNKKNKNDVIVIQEILQDQNDVFDITIIALERLESLLLTQKNVECTIKATAMGTERDLHQNQRTLSGSFKELLMQCSSLSMCSAYDDEEIFEMAVQLFIKNLFEWYAGREELGFFDEVDFAVIPILCSLIAKDMDEIKSVFEKFVYKAPINETLSLNEKYEATRSGIEAWILAQERLKEMQKEAERNIVNDSEIIRSHKRGDIITGYLHIMKAMITMFYVSAPAKLVYNMAEKYLPELVKSVPHINETYIDEWFEKKRMEEVNDKNSDEAPSSNTTVESHAVKNKYEKEVMLPILQDAVKRILDDGNIEYSEIIIDVK